MDPLSLRPVVSRPVSHMASPTNNVRFSAIAATNDILQTGPTIKIKAFEDVRFYADRLKETAASMTVLEQTQTREGNAKKPDVVKTQALIGETGKALEARIQSNRKREAAFERSDNGMPHHEVIRVSSQNSLGMWQVDSAQYKDGYTLTEIMPRSPGKAIAYIGDQYHPLITVENGRGVVNKVSYRFPWSGSGYAKIAKAPVEITDPKLKKDVIGLAQRMVDKTTPLTLGQRVHRLANYGYWNP